MQRQMAYISVIHYYFSLCFIMSALEVAVLYNGITHMSPPSKLVLSDIFW